MPLIRRGPDEPQPAAAADEATAIAALGGGSVQQRWMAARSLASCPDAAAALGRALVDETDERVRGAIFTSLAKIATGESVDAVLPHLRSEDSNLRTGALDALIAMSGPVRPRLTALLHDEEARVRLLACELTRGLPSPEATALLCGLLDTDPAVNVCAAAVDVLAEIGGLEALAVLERCAARFPGEPFLAFAVKVAADRIRSQASG